ncbi:MAG: hypothetical protein ABI383_10860 [Acidobacteriaceae bacterium]
MINGEDNKQDRVDGCADFQAQLPHLMESGADASGDPHLQECKYCSDLVSDLEYIAQQAKLLLPLHEPSPAVWSNIKGTLTREGLMDDDDGGASSGGQKKNSVQARH